MVSRYSAVQEKTRGGGVPPPAGCVSRPTLFARVQEDLAAAAPCADEPAECEQAESAGGRDDAAVEDEDHVATDVGNVGPSVAPVGSGGEGKAAARIPRSSEV